MRCTINLATYLARQTAVNGHGWLCVLLLFLVYLFMFNYLKIHRTDLRQILTVGRTTVVDDQFEKLVFRSLKGRVTMATQFCWFRPQNRWVSPDAGGWRRSREG